MHQWNNRTDSIARVIFVLLPASSIKINGIDLADEGIPEKFRAPKWQLGMHVLSNLACVQNNLCYDKNHVSSASRGLALMFELISFIFCYIVSIEEVGLLIHRHIWTQTKIRDHVNWKILMHIVLALNIRNPILSKTPHFKYFRQHDFSFFFIFFFHLLFSSSGIHGFSLMARATRSLIQALSVLHIRRRSQHQAPWLKHYKTKFKAWPELG
jgi:hypothetical protein